MFLYFLISEINLNFTSSGDEIEEVMPLVRVAYPHCIWCEISPTGSHYVPVWVSFVCWKVFHRDALLLLYTFPVSPSLLSTSSFLLFLCHGNLHDRWYGFEGIDIMCFCRGMFHVLYMEERSADIQVVL